MEAQLCPKDRSFQLSTNVCSIFFVCSEWEWCFFSLTLLRTVRQMTQCQRGRFGGQQGLPGWPELLQLHSSISRRRRIKHLLPESDDLWSCVDYWIAFDGGPQSPWSSHCNNLCSTLTQASIAFCGTSQQRTLIHDNTYREKALKSSKQMIWHFWKGRNSSLFCCEEHSPFRMRMPTLHLRQAPEDSMIRPSSL